MAKIPLNRSIRFLVCNGLLLGAVVEGKLLCDRYFVWQQFRDDFQTQLQQVEQLDLSLQPYGTAKDRQLGDLQRLNALESLFVHGDQSLTVAMRLSNKLTQSGLQIRNFQPSSEANKAFQITFIAAGRFGQLMHFLQLNGGYWPLNYIDDLTIVPENQLSKHVLVSGVLRICQRNDQTGNIKC